MTTNHKPAPSAFDEFYAAPSPARAVALAIADHKNYTAGPIWEFVEQLQKAHDHCDAYPRLVEALRFAMHHCDNVFATAHDPSDRDVAEYKIHRALLADLGETT